MENIYFQHTGREIHVNIEKPWFHYVRYIFEYAGNTPYAREILKKIKRRYDNDISNIKSLLFRRVSGQINTYCYRNFYDFALSWIDEIRFAKGYKKKLLIRSVTPDLVEYAEASLKTYNEERRRRQSSKNW